MKIIKQGVSVSGSDRMWEGVKEKAAGKIVLDQAGANL